MPSDDYCAVWGAVTTIEGSQTSTELDSSSRWNILYSPRNNKDVLPWATGINRDQFKVSRSTKGCSNNFIRGYRTSECPTPTLHITEYDLYDCTTAPKRQTGQVLKAKNFNGCCILLVGLGGPDTYKKIYETRIGLFPRHGMAELPRIRLGMDDAT